MQYFGLQGCGRTTLGRFSVVFTALSLLVVVGGCDGIIGATDGESDFSIEVVNQTLDTGAVNVDEIDGGQYGDIVEGTQEVLRDEDAYASFWNQLHTSRTPVPDRPEVDFENAVVVAVVLGQRPTGGYGVGIDEVLTTESGGQIQVRFTEVVPGDEGGTIQVLTSPYVLAAIEAQDEEVQFSGSKETRSR
jgi:hypothetical protein